MMHDVALETPRKQGAELQQWPLSRVLYPEVWRGLVRELAAAARRYTLPSSQAPRARIHVLPMSPEWLRECEDDQDKHREP